MSKSDISNSKPSKITRLFQPQDTNSIHIHNFITSNYTGPCKFDQKVAMHHLNELESEKKTLNKNGMMLKYLLNMAC